MHHEQQERVHNLRVNWPKPWPAGYVVGSHQRIPHDLLVENKIDPSKKHATSDEFWQVVKNSLEVMNDVIFIPLTQL